MFWRTRIPKPSRSDLYQRKYPSWLQTAKLYKIYMTCLQERAIFISPQEGGVRLPGIEHAIIVQRQWCIVAPRVSNCNSHGHVVDGALAAKHQRKGHQDESWLLVLPLSTFTDNSSKNVFKKTKECLTKEIDGQVNVLLVLASLVLFSVNETFRRWWSFSWRNSCDFSNNFSSIQILVFTPSRTPMWISKRTKLTILHHVFKKPTPSASFHSFATHSHQWKTQSSLGETAAFLPTLEMKPPPKRIQNTPEKSASCDPKVTRNVAAAGRRDPEMLLPAFPEDLASCRQKNARFVWTKFPQTSPGSGSPFGSHMWFPI